MIEFHSFIYWVNKYLLSAYYLLDSIPGFVWYQRGKYSEIQMPTCWAERQPPSPRWWALPSPEPLCKSFPFSCESLPQDTTLWAGLGPSTFLLYPWAPFCKGMLEEKGQPGGGSEQETFRFQLVFVLLSFILSYLSFLVSSLNGFLGLTVTVGSGLQPPPLPFFPSPSPLLLLL